MNTNDVRLLISDLGARLAYHTMLNITYGHCDGPEQLFGVYADGNYAMVNDKYYIDEVKPYLRKPGDMTEEEIDKINMMYDVVLKRVAIKTREGLKMYGQMTSAIYAQFCYARHIDLNGLIEKGLALEAPADMYDLSECDEADAILERITIV